MSTHITNIQWTYSTKPSRTIPIANSVSQIAVLHRSHRPPSLMESAGSVKQHHQVYNNNEHTYNKHTVNIQWFGTWRRKKGTWRNQSGHTWIQQGHYIGTLGFTKRDTATRERDVGDNGDAIWGPCPRAKLTLHSGTQYWDRISQLGRTLGTRPIALALNYLILGQALWKYGTQTILS